ncbi:hypothetical protein [Streptomyces sp. NPDC055056]
MRKSLPENSELLKLFASGLEDAEIAARYGVTRQAVSKRRRTLGLSSHRKASIEASELLKQVWDIQSMDGAGKHRGKHQYIYLRAIIRIRLGDEVHPEEIQNAIGWARRLRSQDVVVTYAPNIGFDYAPRKHSEAYLIRWPSSVGIAEDKLNLFALPTDHEISEWVKAKEKLTTDVQ